MGIYGCKPGFAPVETEGGPSREEQIKAERERWEQDPENPDAVKAAEPKASKKK